MLDRLAGMLVYVTENAIAHDWEFPKDRFVEYGPGDRWWAEKYGFGRRGPEYPACYQVMGLLVIHPTLWAKLGEVR